MGILALRHVGSSGPGLKPASPALAGRFLTTAPPGKSQLNGSYLLHTTITTFSFRTFSPSPKRNSIFISCHFPFPSNPTSQPYATTFYSICLLIPDISYRWIHIICGLLYLLLLSIMFSKFINVITCISTSFLFIAKQCSIV